LFGDPVALVADSVMVTGYLDSMLAKSCGTRAGALNSMLSFLNYTFASPAHSPPWAQRAIQQLRTQRNTLQARYVIELRARSNRVALEENNRWASWPDLLEASRAAVADFQRQHTQLQRAKGGHDVDWSLASDSDARLQWCDV
jgi:hypothetical protein